MSYYKQIGQIQVEKIPIKISLEDWIYLLQYMLPYSAPEPNDDFIQKCWKAALIQIIIKISKRQHHRNNRTKKYLLQLTPTEKHALEELLYNSNQEGSYLSTVFYQIRLQLEHFDNHKKRITSGN